MTRGIKLICAFMVVLLGVSIALLETADTVEAKAPSEGMTAPHFVLKDLKDNTVSLKHVYSRNKVTLVNFWATWCPPCRMEIPDFNKIYNRYKNKSVEIIGVNLEKDPEAVGKFAASYGMKFPIVIDAKGQVASKYQVYVIPMTYVIDNKGEIHKIFQGAASYEQLQSVIDELLKES